MMTDPMKPLGLSMWRLTAMCDARGRREAVRRRHPAPGLARDRAGSWTPMGRGDPRSGRLGDRPRRGDFVQSLRTRSRRAPASGASAPIETDPAIVTELIDAVSVHRRPEARHPDEDRTALSTPAEAFEEHKRS